MTSNFKLNNRWKVILIASFLAWFMEYSLRGINNLVKIPEMAILVFANYFTYCFSFNRPGTVAQKNYFQKTNPGLVLQ